METIERTWRFVRAMVRSEFGNPRPSPYEGQGMGRIVIGGGRMAVMMIDWRRDIPGDQKREYSRYTGSCMYDGKQLVTTVDAAPDPSRIGTEQSRGVRFENGLMILTPPPRVVDGVAELGEIARKRFRAFDRKSCTDRPVIRTGRVSHEPIEWLSHHVRNSASSASAG